MSDYTVNESLPSRLVPVVIVKIWADRETNLYVATSEAFPSLKGSAKSVGEAVEKLLETVLVP